MVARDRKRTIASVAVQRRAGGEIEVEPNADDAAIGKVLDLAAGRVFGKQSDAFEPAAARRDRPQQVAVVGAVAAERVDQHGMRDAVRIEHGGIIVGAADLVRIRLEPRRFAGLEMIGVIAMCVAINGPGHGISLDHFSRTHTAWRDW